MIGGEDLAALVALADEEPDGAPCSDRLRAALQEAMQRRCDSDDPPPPKLGNLTVRREGLPDWWTLDNLALAAPGVAMPLNCHFSERRPSRNVAVVGAGAEVAALSYSSQGGLIVVGDRVRMPSGHFGVATNGTVLVGEDCSAATWARLDARNGGSIRVGVDGLWGSDVNIVTDDMHAIRDVKSGRRTNAFGGRIVVERHVWLCDEVRLTGGAHVGADSIIGMGALVRGPMPPGSVCVGSPARPVRRGVTWTHDDLP